MAKPRSERQTEVLSLRVDTALVDVIREMAEREHRPISMQAELVFIEGLKAMGVKLPGAGKKEGK